MTSKYSNREFLKLYIKIIEDLRKNGRTFAFQNPEIAPYLDFSFRKSNDPETERLIESFAYMFSQIEYKMSHNKNEYQLNFLEQIFPELVSPIASYTILHHTPQRSYFLKSKENKYTIPKDSTFQAKNASEFVCYFTTMESFNLLPIEVEDSKIAQVSFNRVDIQGTKNAITIDLNFLIPFKISKENPLDLKFYIDSDFYTQLTLYDLLFSCNNDIQIKVDENEVLDVSRNNLQECFNFFEKNSGKNLLFPFFYFLNYLNKFLFFNLTLIQNISIESNLKIIIPINIKDDFSLNKNSKFISLNCVPVWNKYVTNLEPLKYDPNKEEYEVWVEGDVNKQISICDIENVKVFDKKNGLSYDLKNFQNKSFINMHTPFENLEWASRKSYDFSADDNGSIYLKILEINKSIEYTEPSHLFLTGVCCNNIMVETIKPFSNFYPTMQDFPIENSKNLNWMHYIKSPINLKSNFEILKFLFSSNFELLVEKIIDINNFKNLINYLSFENQSLKIILTSIHESIIEIKEEDIIISCARGRQIFSIPGKEYILVFDKNKGFPSGLFLFLNFLNSFFNYIRSFNFIIKFRSELK